MKIMPNPTRPPAKMYPLFIILFSTINSLSVLRAKLITPVANPIRAAVKKEINV